MDNGMPPPIGPQRAENTEKNHRARRITDIIVPVREKITGLFDNGVSIDRIARDLEIPPVQVLEHVVRDYAGAKHPGPFAVRKPVASETVRQRAFRMAGRASA